MSETNWQDLFPHVSTYIRQSARFWICIRTVANKLTKLFLYFSEGFVWVQHLDTKLRWDPSNVSNRPHIRKTNQLKQVGSKRFGLIYQSFTLIGYTKSSINLQDWLISWFVQTLWTINFPFHWLTLCTTCV